MRPFRAPRMEEGSGRELPGWRKQSFALPYRGGMIWFEHLDGLGNHTELAREKLMRDRPQLLSPTGPGQVCVVLNETRVDDALADELMAALRHGGKRFTRVCLVGADLRTRRRIRRAAGDAFALAFLPGLEQAKEWLIPAGKAE
ncbi:MAG: hypothetical protein ACI4ML_12985 [Aristaeellaceae bacterium]